MSDTLGFERLNGRLPIFRRPDGNAVIYYAPGYVVRVPESSKSALTPTTFESFLQAAQDAQARPAPHSPHEATFPRLESTPALAAALVHHAQAAQETWTRLHTRTYAPVCLTVYPENRCNLRCAYCYSTPAARVRPDSQSAQQRVSLEAVRESAELVAANCQSRGLPFTLVLHGGGEPALNLDHLAAILDIAEHAAYRYRIGQFKYIATNGVMPAKKASWLAQNFDLIGISCDGPADIQKQQRPLLNGQDSTPAVERTADTLRAAGAPYHMRVTVTPQTVQRLEEITRYLCIRFHPQEIHIEPVYQGGRARPGAFPATGEEAAVQAGAFAAHFTRAQAEAGRYGIRVLFAGCRPWEIHGPYCQVFRDVLTLVPGDKAAPCFKLSDAGQLEKAGVRIGWVESDGFVIDHERVAQMRELLAARPEHCQGCFNQYHCARGCPDDCMLDASPFTTADKPPADKPPNEFRCQVQLRLASAIILQAASRIMHASETLPGGSEVLAKG